jgi:hypothetical protein
MLIIIWKWFNIFQNRKKSPSFIYHLHWNVSLFTAARQRCKRKWRLHNKRRSVFWDSQSQNRSSLCNASFANNFKVIHHVRKTFFGGIDSPRRKDAFSSAKVQDGRRMSEENMNRIRECYAWSPRKSLRDCNEEVWNFGSFSMLWNVLNHFKVIIDITTVI